MGVIVVLAVGFCCWGKGPTLEVAIDNARVNASPDARKQKLLIYVSDDPSICINGMGEVVWKSGKHIQRIGELRKWR